MKRLKKMTGLFLCVILAAGCLSGCGGKSDEAILTTSLKTMTSAKNFDMSMKMNGKVSVVENGESDNTDIDMEVKGTCFMDPFRTKLMTTIAGDGTSVTDEVYFQKEGDKYVKYLKYDTKWTKSDLDDATAVMMEKLNSMNEQLTDDVSKYTRKDGIEENGKKYLAYEYTIAADSVKKAIESMAASGEEDMEEYERKESKKMVDEIAKAIGDIKMTILIDRETEMIYQIRFPAAGMVKGIAKYIQDSMNDYLDDEDWKEKDKREEQTTKIEVSGMDLIITYTNIGSAADFEVPKGAIKEEDLLKDLEDIYDDNDDDIDDECECEDCED